MTCEPHYLLMFFWLVFVNWYALFYIRKRDCYAHAAQ
jgi:hypothetical protein